MPVSKPSKIMDTLRAIARSRPGVKLRDAVTGTGMDFSGWSKWLRGRNPESIVNLERMAMKYRHEAMLIPYELVPEVRAMLSRHYAGGAGRGGAGRGGPGQDGSAGVEAPSHGPNAEHEHRDQEEAKQ